MKRLFGCSVSLTYESQHGEQFVTALIADRGEYWWDERKPDEPVRFDSKIELGEKFFNEIIQHPVPLDMNILAALKRSALGLDFYLWLNYRTFALRVPLRLSWPSLYRQFGTEPDKAGDNRTVQDFRKDSLRELKKIKLAWPDLHYATAKGVLILYPSKLRLHRQTLRYARWVASGPSRSVRKRAAHTFPPPNTAKPLRAALGLSTDRCDLGEFSHGQTPHNRFGQTPHKQPKTFGQTPHHSCS